jgi:chromate reductase
VSDNQLNVAVVCGSLRKGSYNAALARTLPALAPPGMALKPAPAWHTMPIYDFDIQNTAGFPAEVATWADALRAADGVIIVSPEYNWSIPGGLKNAIDWVSRVQNQPFAGKPVALQSAANGALGGGRMQYDLRRSMIFLDAMTLNKPEIFIGNCSQKIDAKTGQITDQQAVGFIQQQLVAFAKFIARLAPKS